MKLKAEVERYRLQQGRFTSPIGAKYGMFRIPYKTVSLSVIASCGEMGSDIGLNWDHVSVSLTNRCPNWEEMSYIKDLFFDEEETVVQFHPKKSHYKNVHPYCLHLWRKCGAEHELPPLVMV